MNAVWQLAVVLDPLPILYNHWDFVRIIETNHWNTLCNPSPISLPVVSHVSNTFHEGGMMIIMVRSRSCNNIASLIKKSSLQNYWYAPRTCVHFARVSCHFSWCASDVACRNLHEKCDSPSSCKSSRQCSCSTFYFLLQIISTLFSLLQITMTDQGALTSLHF